MALIALLFVCAAACSTVTVVSVLDYDYGIAAFFAVQAAFLLSLAIYGLVSGYGA